MLVATTDEIVGSVESDEVVVKFLVLSTLVLPAASVVLMR